MGQIKPSSSCVNVAKICLLSQEEVMTICFCGKLFLSTVLQKIRLQPSGFWSLWLDKCTKVIRYSMGGASEAESMSLQLNTRCDFLKMLLIFPINYSFLKLRDCSQEDIMKDKHLKKVICFDNDKKKKKSENKPKHCDGVCCDCSFPVSKFPLGLMWAP